MRPVRWYIDPIDGTHNFIRGVPLFGTLLAVERDGELQAAVLSAPALDERWWAWRAGGAWARNRGEAPRRIHVSGVTPDGRRPGPLRLRPRHRSVRARAGLRCGSCAMPGASAGSATSGAMPWSPRAPPRR